MAQFNHLDDEDKAAIALVMNSDKSAEAKEEAVQRILRKDARQDFNAARNQAIKDFMAPRAPASTDAE